MASGNYWSLFDHNNSLCQTATVGVHLMYTWTWTWTYNYMLFSQQVMSCACSVSKLLLAEYQLAWFLADWACHIEMNWLHLFIKKHNFCKSTPKYQRYLGVALTRYFALFRTSAPQCHEGISPVFDLIIGEHIYSYQRDEKIRRERKRQKKGTRDRSVTQRQQQGWGNGGKKTERERNTSQVW